MNRGSRKRNPAARAVGGGGVLAVGGGVCWWLSPGGLGQDRPVVVTEGASVEVYRGLTGTVADGPGWLGAVLEVATEGTLVVLGVVLLAVWWAALRVGDARRVAGTVLVGVGTVVAYGVSEAVKLVVDEERPCRALGAAVRTVAQCPEPGDWSFPSNHATLAAALAVGLALVRPALAPLTLPVAVAAALLRVLVGVH
ncbi:phosphatase PAP2 family protein, partial [Streptomyces sp. Act-28]